MRDSVQAVEFVAERLGSLADQFVFLGGAVVGLLVTSPGAARPRATRDVDLIVEVASRSEYQYGDNSLRARLVERGFREATDESVICRWVVGDVNVDIMDTAGEIFGFGNRWYPAAAAEATSYRLNASSVVRLISPACFVATKLEAFSGRGFGDYQASADIEDIVSVIEGRGTIEEDIASASVEVRRFLSAEFDRLVNTPEFCDALPGHLPSDDASQSRLPDLLATLRKLSKID